MSSSSVSQTARCRSNPIECPLSFRRIRIRRAGLFASSVYAPSARLHARVRALGRCVRDHSSLSRGHRRRGHEPTCSRSLCVVIRVSFVSFVSAVDTTCADADTSSTSSGVRSETARRTSILYSSYTISSHRRRPRWRRRGRAHTRWMKCPSCSLTPRFVINFISTNQRLRRRVLRAIGAAIGRDMRVMVKDADTDRMRRARAASPRARSRRERDKAA